MTIKEMHYDYKQKLNKIDSQAYRNLKVPEIDWKLNEAIQVYVKIIAEPRLRNLLGFEINQRNTDSIRTIVVENNCLDTVQYNESSYTADLPEDYWFFIAGEALGSKESCNDKKLRILVKQHDDRHEDSPFDISSFEWREVNMEFFSDKVRVFTDGTFSISKVCLDYIRRPAYVHNADSYINGQYEKLDGTVLTGTQDCDLPELTHSEIVDLAVLITSGDLEIPSYNIKMAKTQLTN